MPRSAATSSHRVMSSGRIRFAFATSRTSGRASEKTSRGIATSYEGIRARTFPQSVTKRPRSVERSGDSATRGGVCVSIIRGRPA